MSKRKKPKSITVIGRCWWDGINGNTYYTSQIMVDGVTVHKTGRDCGYGSQYEWTAAEWLRANGYLPKADKPGPLSVECRESGIVYEPVMIEVPKRKDL